MVVRGLGSMTDKKNTRMAHWFNPRGGGQALPNSSIFLISSWKNENNTWWQNKKKGNDLILSKKGVKNLGIFFEDFSFEFFWPQTGKSDLNIWKDFYRVVNVQHLRIQEPLHLQDKSRELLVAQPYFSLKLNPGLGYGGGSKLGIKVYSW